MAAPLMIAATVLQTVGTISQAEQAASAANRNADALNERAHQVQQAYGQREELQRQRNREALAMQRATSLQNGVDPLSGSALVSNEQQMKDAELDALLTRHEGTLQANNLQSQAAEERFRAKSTRRQGYFNAAGQLVQAGGNYLSMSGFGKNGPGFSGTQTPAPVETRSPYG